MAILNTFITIKIINIALGSFMLMVTSCRSTDTAITEESSNGTLPNVIVQLIGTETGLDIPEKQPL